MKINKDLMDALMMLSFICLVLIMTSDFENPSIKNILLGVSGFIVIVSVAGRVIEAKNNKEETEE